jgi:hypothetical protein
MRQRCYNANDPDYHNYGGRGIKVCKRWGSSVAFYADVGPHPGKGWTLDRINNNGDYRPGNVRWASRSVQTRNMRTTTLSLAKGKAIRQTEIVRGSKAALARKYGVSHKLIRLVLNREAWI